jgi:uncharacterized protein (TIGR02145 family)
LYNWYAVNDPRVLAPKGWHIPTDAEWTILINFLGEDAGKKMKSTSGWKKECSNIKKDYKGTNSSGFSGLPGGVRAYDAGFGGMGCEVAWWSSTQVGTHNLAWFCFISGSIDGDAAIYYSEPNFGLSVRCLRD